MSQRKQISRKNDETSAKTVYKSAGKMIKLRQCQRKLQQLYQTHNQTCKNNKNILYKQCIHLTQDIHQQVLRINISSSQSMSSKKSHKKKPPILDVRDVLSNNITFGVKIKSKQIVAGFAYVSARIISEGVQSLGYYLNTIKTIAVNIDKTQQQGFSQGKQIELAYQIRHFIKMNQIHDEKSYILLKKSLICLIRVVQQVKMVNIQKFYHWGFKEFRVNNRRQLYLEYLLSYFNYLEWHSILPDLDICRLVIDMFSLENTQQLHKNDDVIGFLIRKCFYLIGIYYENKKIIIEQPILKQLFNKCVQHKKYCDKTILVIFQCFYKLQKLELISNPLSLFHYKFQYDYKNRKPATLTSLANAKESCQFLTSAVLYLKKIRNQLKQCTSNHFYQNICLAHQFKSIIQTNLSIFMSNNQSMLFIWDHLINQIHPIKAQMITKCSNKDIFKNAQYFKNYGIFVEIQNIILIHPLHREACNNYYNAYICTNIYLLIIKQLIPHQTSSQFKKSIISLTQRLNQMEIQGYTQWDQLINLCIYYLNSYFYSKNKNKTEEIMNFSSFQRIIFLTKNLLKCQKTIQRQLCKQRKHNDTNMIIHICIFITTAHKRQGSRKYCQELIQTKYCLVICLIQIVQKLVQSVSKLNSLDQIFGFFIIIYCLMKPYCSIKQTGKMKKLISLVKRQSNLKSRLVHRQIFQKVLAQHLETHSLLFNPTSESSNLSKNPSDTSHSEFILQYDEIIQGNFNDTKLRLTQNNFKAILIEFTKTHKTQTLMKQQQKYEILIIIDYLMWLKHYCQQKELYSLDQIIDETIQNFIETEAEISMDFRKSFAHRQLRLIDEHIHKWKSDTRLLAEFLINIVAKSKNIQIIIECYNKLFYLMHSYESRPSLLQNQENEETEYSVGKTQQKSDFNLEFQLEEASLHIQKLVRLCQQMQKKVLKTLEGKKFDCFQAINCGRMINAISNILAIIHNINYSTKSKVLKQKLFQIKLKLPIHQNKKLYIKSQHLFLAQQKYQKFEIISQLSKINSQSMNIQLLCLISIFCRQPFASTNSKCKCHKLHEIIYAVQNLQHMHPHKKIIRHFSGYIWNRSSINQNRILKYQGSLLPLTYATLLSTSLNDSASEKELSNIFECSSGQIFHFMLQKVLFQILECLLMNGQSSQFRSILKLAQIFAIRSRNLRLILKTLECLFSKKNEKNEGNIFLITDSLKSILNALCGQGKFNSRKFGKWCEKYLNNESRVRKSQVFLSSPFQICQSLRDIVQGHGYIGAQMFKILLREVSKKYYIYEWIIFYYYLQIIPQYKITKTQNEVYEVIKITKQTIQQKKVQMNQIKILQYQILESMRNIASSHFYYCQILQSLLSYILQQNLNYRFDDQSILDLSVLMLDHNYLYKKMIEKNTGIILSKDNQTKYQLVTKDCNYIHRKYQNQYLTQHFKKIEYLKSELLKYPLSIIYPLGHSIFSILVRKPIVILCFNRFQFEDYVSTINSLLSRNQQILNSKNIQAKQWWKNRDRFNRQIGKIINQIDIGVWDIMLPQDFYSGDSKKRYAKLYKLALSLKMNSYISKFVLEQRISQIKNQYPQYFGESQNNLNFSTIYSNLQSSEFPESTVQSQNLLLLVPSLYSNIPFETSQYLSQERAVFRLPSIAYLYQNQPQNICRILRIRQASFLINSRNDLPETEQTFLKIKQNFNSWKGIIGRKPTIHQIYELFKTQLFLFMGHGVGTSHISQKQFYNKSIQCSMMIFGCSSVAMAQKFHQFHGITFSHLINGCPCLIGCLWEVTDRDTDKLTQKMFKSILQGPQNIAKVLNLCRKKCRHQYLNGGAIIVYGLPTYYHCE